MRVFQTFLLPDSLVLKYKLSFAAANFSRNLISGGGFDKCYSLIPVNVRGTLPPIEEKGYEVVYSKWREKPGLISKIAIFKEQYSLYKKIKNIDSLWLYNLNVINVFLFCLVKLFKPGIKINIIMLDFTPPKTWHEQNYWYFKLMKKADGIISLSNSSLFHFKNMMILPGVVPLDAGSEPEIKEPNNSFLLSGALNETIAQISMILESFSQLPQCKLHITGNVENVGVDTKIREYSKKSTNIIYHGKLEFSEYMSLLHSCTYVLSTRDGNLSENQCNFPSKIIEALLHNRVVISTIDYEQLNGIRYFYVPSSKQSFISHIKDILQLKPNELLIYANQGKKVAEKYSTGVWYQAMRQIESK